MQKSVIIVAGGLGTRMNEDIPKQFIEILGKPIVMHTLEKFYTFDPSITIVLVLPLQHIALWHALAAKFNFKLNLQIVIGGNTRFESVKNGLQLIDSGIVAVHDAVRPLVSLETIKRAFTTAQLTGNAIPSLPINDSLRLIDSNSSKSLNRNFVKVIQTPQCFEVSIIKEAYNQVYDINFTDDASVLEKTGIQINLVDGNPENIKITQPIDIVIAKALFLALNPLI